MRNQITIDTIAEDDLWYLAKYNVIGERAGFCGEEMRKFNPNSEMISQIREVVRESSELEKQLCGIEECEFENYDAEHLTAIENSVCTPDAVSQ